MLIQAILRTEPPITSRTLHGDLIKRKQQSAFFTVYWLFTGQTIPMRHVHLVSHFVLLPLRTWMLLSLALGELVVGALDEHNQAMASLNLENRARV